MRPFRRYPSDLHFAERNVAIEQLVTRKQFEDWIAPQGRQIGDCVDRLLANCNVKAKDVDAIFMTGGSSFVPAIRMIFERKFGAATPIRAGQEFTSVAQGLAIHAAQLLA